MRLGLGTAQFGSAYGVTNTAGQVRGEAAAGILRLAARAGVEVVDTAHLYAESEAVLGEYLPVPCPFRVVTKTPKFPDGTDAATIPSVLEAAFSRSLALVRQERFHGLLAHDCDDLLGPRGEILWDAMRGLRGDGRVARIGASVYHPAQVDALVDRFTPEIVQLPLNVLDRRFVADGQLRRLADAGVEIHVRSVFLQGLVLCDPDRLEPRFAGLRPHLAAFRAALARAGTGIVEGALNAVLSLPEVTVVIVGVTSADELREILRAVSVADRDSPGIDYDHFSCHDERLVNPARWAGLERAR